MGCFPLCIKSAWEPLKPEGCFSGPAFLSLAGRELS
jgi:hypothetical protein